MRLARRDRAWKRSCGCARYRRRSPCAWRATRLCRRGFPPPTVSSVGSTLRRQSAPRDAAAVPAMTACHDAPPPALSGRVYSARPPRLASPSDFGSSPLVTMH